MIAASGAYVDPVLAGKVVSEIVNEDAMASRTDSIPLTDASRRSCCASPRASATKKSLPSSTSA